MRWGGRMVEWGILALVILVFAGVFGQQLREVQARAELAVIQSTLGALRTALVVEHIKHTVAGNTKSVAVPQRNPFLLLDTVPVNYAGEHAVLQSEAVTPGSWVFDPACSCVGYVLLHPQWLESPPNLPALWFSVAGSSAPLSIHATQTYRWQGQVVN
jgi:hypothetical protein